MKQMAGAELQWKSWEFFLNPLCDRSGHKQTNDNGMQDVNVVLPSCNTRECLYHIVSNKLSKDHHETEILKRVNMRAFDATTRVLQTTFLQKSPIKEERNVDPKAEFVLETNAIKHGTPSATTVQKSSIKDERFSEPKTPDKTSTHSESLKDQNIDIASVQLPRSTIETGLNDLISNITEKKPNEIHKVVENIWTAIKSPDKYDAIETEVSPIKYFSDIHRIQNIKSNRDKSACKWSKYLLDDYISEEFIVLIDDGFQYGRTIKSIHQMALQKQLIEYSQLVFPPSRQFLKETGDSEVMIMEPLLRLCNFYHWRQNETACRGFLNIILQSVLKQVNQVYMKYEEEFGRRSDLPTAKCDYTFYSSGVCIGVMEAKSPVSLSPDSMAQLLLQLLHAQRLGQSSKMRYFGILSDCYKFVFVVIDGRSLKLEAKRASFFDNHAKIFIHSADTWEKLYGIVNILVGLMKDSINCLNSCTCKDTKSDNLKELTMEELRNSVKNKVEEVVEIETCDIPVKKLKQHDPKTNEFFDSQ